MHQKHYTQVSILNNGFIVKRYEKLSNYIMVHFGTSCNSRLLVLHPTPVLENCTHCIQYHQSSSSNWDDSHTVCR